MLLGGSGLCLFALDSMTTYLLCDSDEKEAERWGRSEGLSLAV